MDPFEWAAVGLIVVWVAFAYKEAKKARKNSDLIIEEIGKLGERIAAMEGVLLRETDNPNTV